MIVQTVALPVYRSKKITWLVMESLCNQIGIDYEWELIICEEKHDQQLGKNYFREYESRLKKVGCKRFQYIELDKWVPLSNKWLIIGKASCENSKSFLLQAADCYSPSMRLKNTKDYINDMDYDWFDYSTGYFYSFRYKKLIIYTGKNSPNLYMAFKTKYSRTIPKGRKRGVDGFLFSHIRSENSNIKIKNIWQIQDSLDTDGLNNISYKRYKYFVNPKKVFSFTDKKLEDLMIPRYIKERLNELS